MYTLAEHRALPLSVKLEQERARRGISGSLSASIASWDTALTIAGCFCTKTAALGGTWDYDGAMLAGSPPWTGTQQELGAMKEVLLLGMDRHTTRIESYEGSSPSGVLTGTQQE